MNFDSLESWLIHAKELSGRLSSLANFANGEREVLVRNAVSGLQI